MILTNKLPFLGIAPKLNDWNVKDSIRFNEMVVTKKFVSIIKSLDYTDKDTNSNIVEGEILLGLELIDTSTNEDIFIGAELIRQNRAEKVKEEL